MTKEQFAQERMRRVDEFQSSGLTMKAWCEQQGYSIETLKYWLYKKKSMPAQESTPSFIPVSVLPQEPLGPSAKGLLLHIGPARIEIHPGFEPQLLRDVIQALRLEC